MSIVRNLDEPLRVVGTKKALHEPKSPTKDDLRKKARVTEEMGKYPVGDLGTMEYRLQFSRGGLPCSPWHDVPLKIGKHYNMLTEIPKDRYEKLEVATRIPFNPLVQDVKNGKPRVLPRADGCLPEKAWNYGCLPQTWEDPSVIDSDATLAFPGDNDPIDAVEVGADVLPSGSVTPVKVLGAIAMLDDGELDWKVVVIRAADPHAADINCLDDIERFYPECGKDVLHTWFRLYKGEGKVSFGAPWARGVADAEEAIAHTHAHWRNLLAGSTPNPADKAGEQLWTAQDLCLDAIAGTASKTA